MLSNLKYQPFLLFLMCLTKEKMRSATILCLSSIVFIVKMILGNQNITSDPGYFEEDLALDCLDL